MQDISSTLLVLKLDKVNSSKKWQSWNIDDILITLLVSKFSIFKYVKLLHPLNIFDISTTFLVLLFENSTDLKEIQSWNI